MLLTHNIDPKIYTTQSVTNAESDWFFTYSKIFYVIKNAYLISVIFIKLYIQQMKYSASKYLLNWAYGFEQVLYHIQLSKE